MHKTRVSTVHCVIDIDEDKQTNGACMD